MEKLCRKDAEYAIGARLETFFPLLNENAAAVFNNGRKKSIKKYTSSCFMGNGFSADIQLVPTKDKNKKIKEVRAELDNIKGLCPLEKKLADSEKMVAVGKMASSLAHGVRNPLNAIKGAVVYLREKYGHEATFFEFSTIINEEIDKLDAFISSFLSAAKGEMTYGPSDLSATVKSILVMIRPRAKTQGIKLTADLSDLPLIEADIFQVEQALFNIVNNAFEAMPEGGELKIRTGLKWEKSMDYALIEVTDTGKGIPDEKLQAIGSLSEGPDGADRGFGVFLSREVINAHNGRLLWESVKGRGTTFKILLPVKQSG